MSGSDGGAVASDLDAPAAEREANGATDGLTEDETGANRPAVQTRAVIKTGEIAVVSDELDRVHGEARRLVETLDGYVANEDTNNDRHGEITSSMMKLRVPAESFVTALDALADLGQKKYINVNEKDVTTEVIDVAARVETTRRSLRRLRTFLSESGNVSELVRLENEIANREAELQSLVSQQDYLASQTSMSSITLHLSTPEKYVPPPDALEDAGFLAGLKGGWNALVDTVVVALTVFGAFLPFGVAFGLIAVPLVWLFRRFRRTAAAKPPEAQPSAP